MSHLTCNQLTRLVNKKKHEKNKIAKLKKFFFLILENDGFESHKSHQLSANIRISVFLFFHEKPMKAITIQEISYDRNDKV